MGKHLPPTRSVGSAVVVALLLALSSSSAAQAQGVIEGVVTDASGPVSGAEVSVVESGGFLGWSHTLSGADGHFSLTAYWDPANLGAAAPAGSTDGYFEQDSISVPTNGATVVNPVLPPAPGTAQLSGVAEYQPAVPDAGVEVIIEPVNRPIGEVFYQKKAYTETGGVWSYGTLPAGTYQLIFVVAASGVATTEATQYVTLGEGSNVAITTVLHGPPPEATLVATVTEPGGLPAVAAITLTPAGGTPLATRAFSGSYRTSLPAGAYTLEILGDTSTSDIGSVSDIVSVAAGAVTSVHYELPPLPVPAGTTASNTMRDLEYLNSERARWGLPAGLVANGNWSQACAAHDRYLDANNLLEHPEYPDRPFYSPGGDWAGTHSVLAGGPSWTTERSPWQEAPIHLNQLLAPDLRVIGIDDSSNRTCATTWPGMRASSALPGTVVTYPGDGTRGFPPAEDAAELPFVPGQFVGIPEGTVAGRELFVYEELPKSCEVCAPDKPTIVTAALSGPSGPVPIKWVDANSPPGGYLAGAIIIPVSPLAPNASYHASVTLGAQPLATVPEVSHTWTFATGPNNLIVVPPRLPPPPRGSTLSHLTIRPRTFKAARGGATVARHKYGAVVRYMDARRGTAQFKVMRRRHGKRRGRSCVAPSRSLVRARSCLRLVAVLRFSRWDRVGANRFRFNARSRHRALAPGSYVLTASAGAPGTRVASIGASFEIVR